MKKVVEDLREILFPKRPNVRSAREKHMGPEPKKIHGKFQRTIEEKAIRPIEIKATIEEPAEDQSEKEEEKNES
jgi:hypothetical protein